MHTNSKSDSYAAAGVDVTAGYQVVDRIKPLVKSTYIDGVLGSIGDFGGQFAPNLTGMTRPILVSGTDGVGTKLKIAFLLDKHDTVGIDCVAMCVNDIICCGAKPQFFLDYIACGKNIPSRIEQIVTGIADGCRQSGCALIGGETAEMPGFYPIDEYDLAGFTVGIVDRPAMIGPARVQDGDVLIGLASSGLHSNGYSLARKVCTEDKTLYELTIARDELEGDSVLDALLEPTRIYVKSIRSVLLQCPGAIHSLAHITGGGITENLNRALPSTLDAEIQVGSWNMVPILPWVCRAAHLNETEALKTFNMGLGMILAVAPQKAEEVAQLLADAGEEVYIVGQVVPGVGKVVYLDEEELFAAYSEDEEAEED